MGCLSYDSAAAQLRGVARCNSAAVRGSAPIPRGAADAAYTGRDVVRWMQSWLLEALRCVRVRVLGQGLGLRLPLKLPIKAPEKIFSAEMVPIVSVLVDARGSTCTAAPPAAPPAAPLAAAYFTCTCKTSCAQKCFNWPARLCRSPAALPTRMPAARSSHRR